MIERGSYLEARASEKDALPTLSGQPALFYIGPQYFSSCPLGISVTREERAQLVCKYCYANVSKNLKEKTGWYLVRAAARFFASAPCVPYTKLQAQFVA